MHGMTAHRAMEDAPHVSIAKAENGYMVTLSPPGGEDSFRPHTLRSLGAKPYLQGEISGSDYDALEKDYERRRPRVFVYAEISEALKAIETFLLDGKMPTPGP